jgi:hypothetical protein
LLDEGGGGLFRRVAIETSINPETPDAMGLCDNLDDFDVHVRLTVREHDYQAIPVAQEVQSVIGFVSDG